MHVQGGGTPGMTMGDWLVEKGLDAPRSNKPKAASSLTLLRQRQVQQARAGHTAMQGRPQQQHIGRQVIACFSALLLLRRAMSTPVKA